MNKHASDEAATTTVSALSDDRLLEQTKELSRIEHHLEVVVIDHLREIQKRRLYLRRGFSAGVHARWRRRRIGCGPWAAGDGNSRR